MVIDYAGDSLKYQDIYEFLKENEFTGLKLKLLLFWGKHPQAKFNIDCIAHVLDITRQHLRQILKELIDTGMVNEQYFSSGIAHYSLNPHHALCLPLQQLASLDWSLIKNIEGEIEREAVPA